MIITSEKIEVSLEMMAQNNMTRGDMLGVPVNYLYPNEGLSWKKITELTDDDFDTIECYFLVKKQTAEHYKKIDRLGELYESSKDLAKEVANHQYDDNLNKLLGDLEEMRNIAGEALHFQYRYIEYNRQHT